MKLASNALALALLATPLAATTESTPTVFTDTTEVRVINVDVVVTDRDGVPLLGLGPDDFVVKEDGVPVEITNFTFVDERPADRAPDLVDAQTSSLANTSPERRGVDLFVYVDNFNMMAGRRNEALDDLTDHLRRTRAPNDRVTLIVHNGGRPRFLLHQSTSFDEISAAVDEIREMGGGEIDDRLLYRQALREINAVFDRYTQSRFGGSACLEAEFELVSIARAVADVQAANVGTTIRGLETAIRVLSAVEGRKSVLYVSNGFPAQPGLGVFGLLADVCGSTPYETESSAYNESNRFTELASHANTNRVTFYPLQASGLLSAPISSVESFNRQFVVSTSTDMAVRQNFQASLISMALDTGGKAILNTNDFRDQLETVDSQLRAYYSIGYRPPGDADGRRHEIDVELVRKVRGARISARRSYRAKTSHDLLVERAEAALEGFADNPLGIEMAVESLLEEESPRAGVTLTLDRSQLTYLPVGDRWACDLDVVITHVTEKGSSTRTRRITLHADSVEGRPPSGVEEVRIGAPAAPGLNRYALGVVDVVSSLVTTMSTDLVAPES